MKKSKVYIEKAGNMTKDGAKAIVDVCKDEFNLSEKIEESPSSQAQILYLPSVKEFIKWCETHSHMSDGVQVIAISKLKEGAGDKLS